MLAQWLSARNGGRQEIPQAQWAVHEVAASQSLPGRAMIFRHEGIKHRSDLGEQSLLA